jgi:RNA recognition motif-containing protein
MEVASAAPTAPLLVNMVEVLWEVSRPIFRNVQLQPNTDISSGYSVREELPLPDKPPFTVHLGNLSFDATVGDVTDFFTGCECTNVRIIEDKLEMKPKGFGYAEFATLDGLKQALTLNGSQFQGRNIRISVADPRKF